MKLVLVKHSLPEIIPTLPASQWHLGEPGRTRSGLLAEELSKYPLDMIVSSVEPKAIETAQIVAKRLGKPSAIAEGLHEHERNRALFQNAVQFEKSVAEFFAHPSELVFGEETADAARARFANAVERVIENYSHRDLVIVSHGTVITLFVSQAMNLDPFAFWKRLGLPSFVVLNVIVKSEWGKQSPSGVGIASQTALVMTLEKVVENVK